MRFNKSKWLTFACAVAVMLSGVSTQAGPMQFVELTPNSSDFVLLSDLISGDIPGLIVGDKEFSGFGYIPTAGGPSPDEISVAGRFVQIEDPLNPGELLDAFGLSFGGSFAAGANIFPPILEASLFFDVDVLDENNQIVGVLLDGSVSALGNSQASIVENFIGIDVPSIFIEALSNGNELIASQSSDQIFFSDEDIDFIDQNGLSVFKDINLNVGVFNDDLGEVVINRPVDRTEITTFSQLFVQRTIIPEPTTCSLALLAMTVVVTQRRQKA